MKLLRIKRVTWANGEKSILSGVAALETEDGSENDWPFAVRDNYDTQLGQEIWDRVNSGEFGAVAEYEPPQEPTPEERRAAMPNLTARQLRLGLLQLGKLAGVPTAISALPSPHKEQAEIEWQYASEFRRLHPLIVQLIPILGLTDEQVDTVWLEFAQV